jgi:phage shock protein A
MATLLEKVKILISANVHALIDQALKSNSLAVVDQYIRQVEDQLANLEDAAATVGGELKSLQRKLEEHQRRAMELDQAVDSFLLQGNETAAAAAQSRLNGAQQLVENYQEQLNRQQGEYQNLLEAKVRLEARHATMQQQRAELQALLELAKSKEIVAKTMKGLDTLMGSGDSDVNRIAQSIYARLDKANAAIEVRGASLDEQIDQVLGRNALNAQLEARKQRLALNRPPEAKELPPPDNK